MTLNILEKMYRGLGLEVATKLEEYLMQSSRSEVDQYERELAALSRELLGQTDPKVPFSLKRAQREDPVFQAYLAGQVAFAQLLAAQAATKRADDGFVDLMLDPGYVGYVKALAQRNLTGVELAQSTGEQPETVSRKLRRMRELGICDFRRAGNRVINFLTPAASAISKERLQVLATSTPSADKLAWLNRVRTEQTPSHMQDPATFAPNDERFALAA